MDGSGLNPLIDIPHYRTRQEAYRAWRQLRRIIWSRTHRFTLPNPARFYDGLTEEGRDFLHRGWNNVSFDLAGALDALAVDRANLTRFGSTREARSISDYLAVYAADLDRIEESAHELATFTPSWRRLHPPIYTGLTYGDESDRGIAHEDQPKDEGE
jgi:hypothetical protein